MSDGRLSLFLFFTLLLPVWASLVARPVKKSVCNVGDPGSIPGSEDPLEKEMAAHSSILAWGIPGTEEPGGLQSMGLQRIRQD